MRVEVCPSRRGVPRLGVSADTGPSLTGDELVLRGRDKQALTHDGNTELALHMAHAIIKADPRGERIVKDFKKSPRRIDLAMASIMAFDRAKELVGKTVTFW